MNDELHSNDLIADDLLTVLASSRETPIVDAAFVESAEASGKSAEADSQSSNKTVVELPRREPARKRVSAKHPPRDTWSAFLLDWFCYAAILCAVVSLFRALALDFLPKLLPQKYAQTASLAPETHAAQQSALANVSALNALNAQPEFDEPPLEITHDAAETPIFDAAPEFDLAPVPNAVAETIVNNENGVENVESVETPISNAAPLLEKTLASHSAVKSYAHSENAIENVKPKETPAPTSPQIYTKKISEVKIGERAVGTNPLGSNPLESDETIFERVKHCGYKLSYQKANGTYCHINLLRPEDWLDYVEIQYRGRDTGRVLEDLDFQLTNFSPLNFFDYDKIEPEVWLELPEMGVVGWAKLEDVDENVSIQPGPGNVVTGTFAHISDDVINLLIEDQDKPIGCTTNHPFWSIVKILSAQANC